MRLIIIVIFILLILSAGAYYVGLNKKSSVARVTPTQETETIAQDGQLFSGKLTPINQNPGLLVASETDLENEKLGNGAYSVDYYDAGKYLTGKYQGYRRIVAFVHTSSMQVGYDINLFATKDDKTYILDTNVFNIDLFDSENINKSKVTSTDTLSMQNPDVIILDPHFVLKKVGFATETDKNYKTSLLTDVSKFRELPSKNPFLKYYARASDLTTLSNYVDGTTEIVVVDETGLAFFYSLVSKQNFDLYNGQEIKATKQQQEYNAFKQDWQAKYNQLKKEDKALKDEYSYTSEEKSQIVGRPEVTYPGYISLPNLSFKDSDIKQSGDKPINLYKTYDTAFPEACGLDYYTPVAKNISDGDLTKIGATDDFDIYVLTNNNHPLYKMEFDAKISNISAFKEINSIDPPSYEKYVSSYPLIFAKDPWGRWFVLGEFDYRLMGGCGKPVIYLYPTKNTRVKISFKDKVKLDLAIPIYNQGWDVLAHPDGSLSDLQPKFTDCSLIDATQLGSEYAQNACLKNNYPYIYWAGKNSYEPYPNIDYGWIVSKGEVLTFLDKKLTAIGMTSQEKTDMISYWGTQIISKDAPFYRISFLNTTQMNNLIPMRIEPKPDTVYRIFLDYLPLTDKPTNTITPPVLEKIHRTGFTVVEWGGLKR